MGVIDIDNDWENDNDNVDDQEGLFEALTVAELEVLVVTDGVAEYEIVKVGVLVNIALTDDDVEDVTLDDGETVGDDVVEDVGVMVGVGVGRSDFVGVTGRLRLPEMEEDELDEDVRLMESVGVADPLELPLNVIDGDWVGVIVVVVLVLVLGLVEAVADIEALNDDVSEMLVVCETLIETVCDWLNVANWDNDSEGLSE